MQEQELRSTMSTYRHSQRVRPGRDSLPLGTPKQQQAKRNVNGALK